MRDILFRGKAIMTEEEMKQLGIENSDRWVYGSLIQSNQEVFIVGDIADWDSDYLAHEWWLKVEPETVGQMTGLKDENGSLVFEGDILDVQEDTVQIVCWDEHQARYKSVPLYLYHINAGAGGWTGHNLHNRKLEVIGNIHQHPELLNN